MSTRKKLSVVVFVIAILLAIALHYAAKTDNPLVILYYPIDLIAGLLRQMSLHSSVGNGFAIGIYVILCLIPVAILAFKIYKKTVKGDDVLLALLSGFSFFMLYAFINPAVLASLSGNDFLVGETFLLLTPAIKGGVALFFYSILIFYGTLRLLRRADGLKNFSNKEDSLNKFKFILYLFLNFYLFLAAYSGMLKALSAGGDMPVLLFVVTLVPVGFMAAVLFEAMGVIDAIQEAAYGGQAAERLRAMVKMAKYLIYASVVCSLLSNGIQLIPGLTMDMNILVQIPFLPLIIAFTAVVLAKYFEQSDALYEDKQSII